MGLNRETDWSQLSTLLGHVLERWTRANLHTSIPGIIETYDADTRRARVQPALDLVLADPDDPTADGETMPRAVAVNVPVLFPAGGGFSLLFPLRAGDSGLMLFSERGLTAFKQTYEAAVPDRARFFDESDAMFLAGFGPLALTPASSDGAALQTDAGDRSVRVGPDSVEAHVGSDQSVVIGERDVTVNTARNVTLNAGGQVRLGGGAGKQLVTRDFLANFYNSHTHISSAPGSPTPPPVVRAPVTAGNDITDKTRAE